MKSLSIFFLCVITLNVSAQLKTNKLYGTWVKTKVTYVDGTDLPDNSILKFSYLKYIFSYPNDVSASAAYFEIGQQNQFQLNGNILNIITPQGGLMNSFKAELFKDTLMLVEEGKDGFKDPSALKFYFIPEYIYQNSIPLTPSDIHSIIANDTIYKESPKIYARYKGERFQSVIYTGIAESINMHNRNAHFVASFVVSKNGNADSVKIIEGIDEVFDRQFIKVFNRERKRWKPALLNGKSVSVMMLIDLGYLTSERAIPNYFLSNEANQAYNQKDYAKALYYFDQALAKYPSDKDNLLKRGICRMMLGNKEGACEDWARIKSLGGSESAEIMLKKYCK
jgi:tetratricopeptide (TPR) repeat protein